MAQSASGCLRIALKLKQWPDPSSSSTSTSTTRTPTDIGRFNWTYDPSRNVSTAFYRDAANSEVKWAYKIYYAGTNAAHNKQMGNATKWEQVESNDPLHDGSDAEVGGGL